MTNVNRGWQNFPPKTWWDSPRRGWEHSPCPARRVSEVLQEEFAYDREAVRGMAWQANRRAEERRERRSARLWRGRARAAQRPRLGGGRGGWVGVQEMARPAAVERLLSVRGDAERSALRNAVAVLSR